MGFFIFRLPAPSDLCVDGAASSTPKRRASSPLTTSGSTDDGEDHKPTIKQERIDTTNSSPEDPSHKKCRTEVADAESNTTHSVSTHGQQSGHSSGISICLKCGYDPRHKGPHEGAITYRDCETEGAVLALT
ncbi:hypothetical protein YQE_02915, partial [Dendroctonus ponderosae]